MVAYYNEFDPFAAAWLRELIVAGHIAPGDVDERSIEDVTPNDLRPYTQCHFFAGIGVWSHALRGAGWRDDEPIWTGSCPCQPFSSAGDRRGVSDERHLWPAFFHLIRECSPSIVIGEQVAGKDGLAWLDVVSNDLEASSYAVGSADLCAAGFGAPHIRQRLYWMAHAYGDRKQSWVDQISCGSSKGLQNESAIPLRRSSGPHFWSTHVDAIGGDGSRYWLEDRPGTYPLANGSPARMGRLRGYGNAIVAPVAQGFIEAVIEARASLALLT